MSTPEHDPTRLEQLEAASAQVEELARQVGLLAKAFGGEIGARSRLELVKQRLRVALDELSDYPSSASDITDE
jgi:hypothetical protein